MVGLLRSRLGPKFIGCICNYFDWFLRILCKNHVFCYLMVELRSLNNYLRVQESFCSTSWFLSCFSLKDTMSKENPLSQNKSSKILKLKVPQSKFYKKLELKENLSDCVTSITLSKPPDIRNGYHKMFSLIYPLKLEKLINFTFPKQIFWRKYFCWQLLRRMRGGYLQLWTYGVYF